MKGRDQLRTCVYIGDNIKMYLKETGREGGDWIQLVAWEQVAGLCECDYRCSGLIRGREFLS